MGDEHRSQVAHAGRALPAGIDAGMGDASMAVRARLGRRIAALIIIVIGALLMWLSPEQLIGVVTLTAGIALEVLGIHLDHA